MTIALLILFCSLPITVSFIVAVESYLHGGVADVRLSLVLPRLKQLFGRGLISSAHWPQQCGFLLALFVWLAAAGGVLCGLILPEAAGGNFGILFVTACLLAGVSRDIPQCLARRSAQETAESLRSLLQSLSLWLAVGISLAAAGLLCGSLSWSAIVDTQAKSTAWLLAIQPLGVLVLVIVAIAPAESKMKTSQQTNLADYCRLIAFALIIVCTYGGGWHFWGVAAYTTPNEPSLLQGLLRGFVFLLKSAIVLCGLVAFRHTAFAGKLPTCLTLTWNVLLPLVCLNFVIALIAETCLQPGDMLSRFLLAWIVVGGGTAYGLLFHHKTITAQWELLRD